MLNFELIREEGLLIVQPKGPLEKTDFENMAMEVDPYIQEKGNLNGLMIYTKSFPGWINFSALRSHLKFVRNHFRKIRKIAFVTQAGILTIMPGVANLFVKTEIRHFQYGEKNAALNWLKS